MKHLRMGVIALCLALTIASALTGCAPAAPPSTGAQSAATTDAVDANATQTEFVAVASFYPMYVALVNVARGAKNVRTLCLAPPVGGCVHDYQLTTRDMRELEGANALIINGAGLESFLDKAIAASDRLQVIDASQGIDLIPERYDRQADNAHIWTGISDHIKLVRTIAAGLSEQNPENSAVYAQNADAYAAKLTELKGEIETQLAPHQGVALITAHDSWPYFARDFNLDIASVIEREHEAQPQAGDLAQLVNDAKANSKVSLIITEPNEPTAFAETVSRETGLRIIELNPLSGGEDEQDPGDIYIETFRENARKLKEALS